MSFEDWQLLRPENPPWMRGKNTGALVSGLGKVKDELVARLRAGVLERFPDTALAGDDALDYKGSERLLPRGAFETSAAYATRLRQAFEAWSLAGGHGALLRQLELAGFQHGYLIQSNGIWTHLANPVSNFTARYEAVGALTAWISGGGGSTLTAPVNGTQVFDGAVAALNDVVLVRFGPTPQSPGLYVVTQAGDGTHPVIITRRTGWQVGNLLTTRTSIDITDGATMKGQRWETLSAVTVGTTATLFEHGLLVDGVMFGDTNLMISRGGRRGWFFGDPESFWSKFLLLFTYGLSPTSDQVRAINATVDRWKPAYAVFFGTVEIINQELWGWPPERQWGTGGVWGGVSNFYPPT